jgi:hypothetical protein
MLNIVQESFYAKLKKFSDEANTNLYVSNIPRNMNEHVSLLQDPLSQLTSRLTRGRNFRSASCPTKSCHLASSVTIAAMDVALASLGMLLNLANPHLC